MLLCPVQRHRGMARHRLRLRRVRTECDAQAGGRYDFLAVDIEGRVKLRQQFATEDGGVLRLCEAGQQYGEFVVGDARHRGVLGQRGAQALCRCRQQRVDVVAEQIVEARDAIECEPAERDGGALRLREQPVERGEQTDAVRQPGGRIVTGEMIQLCLHRHAVHDRAEGVGGNAQKEAFLLVILRSRPVRGQQPPGRFASFHDDAGEGGVRRIAIERSERHRAGGRQPRLLHQAAVDGHADRHALPPRQTEIVLGVGRPAPAAAPDEHILPGQEFENSHARGAQHARDDARKVSLQCGERATLQRIAGKVRCRLLQASRFVQGCCRRRGRAANGRGLLHDCREVARSALSDGAASHAIGALLSGATP